MPKELTKVEVQSLSSQEQTELDGQIDSLISQHRDKAYELNNLVLESAMILTSADKRAKEKAAQSFLTRLGKNISGANNRSDNEINQDLVEAQYAAQKVLVKLAEQNLLTFELFALVNNKLNDCHNETQKKLVELKNRLLKAYESLQNVEKNVELINWVLNIKYNIHNGVEYLKLPYAMKIACVVRDFSTLMKGKQGTINDLNLLRKALEDLGLKMIDREDFIRQVGTNAQLHTHLLGGDSRLGDFATENENIIFDIQRAHEKHDLKFFPEESDSLHAIPVKEINANDFALELLCELKQLTLAKEQSDEAERLFLSGDIVKALPPLEATTNADNIQKRRYMLAIIHHEGAGLEKNPDSVRELLSKNISEGDVCSIFFGVRIGLIPKGEASDCFQALAELADAGNIFAQYELAHYVNEDSGNKLKYMKLAADQNYFLAAFELGKMYYLGCDGASEDNEQARRYFEIAAKFKQHAEAMLYLGNIYLNGFGVDSDKEKAVELYKKAHERGGFSDNSINNIACFYDEEKKNPDEAVNWWTIGAEKNFPMCLANLGRAYYKGRGVKKDWREATDYFKQAIAAGDKSGLSEYLLGHIYWNGCDDIPADKKKSVELYQTAHKLGRFSDNSINNIACFYDEEGNNPDEAVNWWTIGAEKNFPMCLANLGRAYYKGRGVKENWKEATDYFNRAIAAEDKSGLSEYLLGYIYWNGCDDIPADKKKAIELYDTAYERGRFSKDSTNKIGDFYRKNKQWNQAVKWWTRGAKKNFPMCLANLGMVNRYGYGVNKNWAQSVEYFKQAIAAGDKSGFSENHLGDIYFEGGYGVARDYKQSVDYYEKAIAKGRELWNEGTKNLVKAAYHLGNDCYPTDKKEAMECYKKSIEWYEKFTPTDKEKSGEWDKKVGKYKVNCAQGIAQCYEWLDNYPEALKWWIRGSELRSSYCALMAANFYRYGMGTDKNYAEAIKYYKLNIELGDDSGYSEKQIADIFWASGTDENSVPVDYSQVRQWMREAAKKGNLYAKNWMEERGFISKGFFGGITYT